VSPRRFWEFTNPRRLRRYVEHARHILGLTASAAKVRELAGRMVAEHYPRNISGLVAVVVATLTGRSSIRLRGLNHLWDILAEHPGIVLVLPHTTSLRQGAAAAVNLRGQLPVMIQSSPHWLWRCLHLVARWFPMGRQTILRSLVMASAGYKTMGVRRLVRVLRQASRLNHVVVCLAGDRADLSSVSAVVRFLDAPCRFPADPIRLALLAGAPIIPAAVLHDDAGFFLALGPIITSSLTGASRDEVRRYVESTAQAIANYYTHIIRQYPEQWAVNRPGFWDLPR